MGKKPPLYFNRCEFSLVEAERGWFRVNNLVLVFLDVKPHAILNPRLDRIQQDRIPTRHGADGRRYYQIDYEIHASYYSAHCEYKLWYEGRNHGSVKADYKWVC